MGPSLEPSNADIRILVARHRQLSLSKSYPWHCLWSQTNFYSKKSGKVWIYANWTEIDVAEALIERGVLSSDIVLGFQPKYVREVSGFAVA